MMVIGGTPKVVTFVVRAEEGVCVRSKTPVQLHDVMVARRQS